MTQAILFILIRSEETSPPVACPWTLVKTRRVLREYQAELLTCKITMRVLCRRYPKTRLLITVPRTLNLMEIRLAGMDATNRTK